MQGLAARFFGGRSEAEPGVARTGAEERLILPTAPENNYELKITMTNVFQGAVIV